MKRAITSTIFTMGTVFWQFALGQTTTTPMTYSLTASDSTQIEIKTTIKDILVVGSARAKVADTAGDGTLLRLSRMGGFRGKGASVVMMNLCVAEHLGSKEFKLTYICNAYRVSKETFQASISPSGCKLEGKEAEKKYLTEFEGLAISYHTRNGRSLVCRQELAVVVDGVWLQDPVNGTSNFRLQF